MRRIGQVIIRVKQRFGALAAQRDLSLLVAARVAFLSVVLLSVFVSSLVYGTVYSDNLIFIYAPIALLYLFCLVSALWLMWREASPLFTWVQLCVDVGIITAVVYLTGGTISPFLFLYLPPIMAASIVASRRTALIMAGISGAAYGSLSLALYQHWILTADGSPLVETTASALVLQLIGLCSAMILIAVLTSFLTYKLSSSYKILEQTQNDLSALNNRQQALITSFPEAIITTDLEERVTSLNNSAEQLFGLSSAAGQSKLLRELFQQVCKDCPNDKISAEENREFEVVVASTQEQRNLVCHSRPVISEDGSLSGLIFVLQDVTKLRSMEEQMKVQERMARLLAAKSGNEESRPIGFDAFVGESLIMQKVFNLIKRVAPSDATVLISGESGTGKELVAKAIHQGSARGRAPFVALNCGAIPENLIESELFGHKKGSFTGADSDYNGMFRQAEGGTIFLDEIGELPLQMQAKLLRTIQEKKVRPIGGDRDIPMNVRIVAATNRNLKQEIEKGGFREDLFYRLNVINISLPPLRDRKDDVPILVNAILRRLVDNESVPMVSPVAMQYLLNYRYPGNVRELENLLERALVLGGEVILPEHLPDAVRMGDDRADATRGLSQLSKETNIIIDERFEFPVNLDELLGRIERKYLEIALFKSNGAKKKAADLLGMNFRSFRYRLQKFGLADGESDTPDPPAQ